MVQDLSKCVQAVTLSWLYLWIVVNIISLWPHNQLKSGYATVFNMKDSADLTWFFIPSFLYTFIFNLNNWCVQY